MLIDLSFFQEFYHAEKIDNYNELMNYMMQFTWDFYEQNHIYTEEHFYEDTLLDLPVIIHFRAHILLARESNDIKEKRTNYSKAIRIQKKVKIIKNLFKEELKEAYQFYKKYSRGSYVDQNGPIKANNRKQKLSNSMKSIQKDTLIKRNNAISKGKLKQVVHIESGVVFDCAKSASEILGINVNNIRKCCRGEIDNFHNNTFFYC
jgi:hypothetical protein